MRPIVSLDEWIGLTAALEATPDITPSSLAAKAKRICEDRKGLARSNQAMREALRKTLTCASLNSDVRALVVAALAEARKGGE